MNENPNRIACTPEKAAIMQPNMVTDNRTSGLMKPFSHFDVSLFEALFGAYRYKQNPR